MMIDDSANTRSPALNDFVGLQELTTAVLSAASDGNLSQILQEIAHTARRMVRARYAALGIPDHHGGLKHFVISGLDEEEFARIPHPPVGKGLLGAIMHQRVAIRLPVLTDDPRSAGFPAHHPSMTSFLGVPIQVGQHLFGQIYLSNKMGAAEFSEEDQHLVETLASYAALAIAALELSEQQKRVSILEERERISMELHDSVIQMLYAVGMELQLIKADMDLPGRLETPIRHLDASIGEIRRHIMNLKANDTGRITVRALLEATLRQLHVPETMQMHIEAPDSPAPLDPPALNSVCQICLELLSNAIRHANAASVKITVFEDRLNPAFVVNVTDDGKGFDAERVEAGLGLINIQRRVEKLNGSFALLSTPGSGTRVNVRIPLPD
jgi:signal transduction histidine kinase